MQLQVKLLQKNYLSTVQVFPDMPKNGGRGGGVVIMGGGKFLKSLDIVARGVLTSLFLKTLPHPTPLSIPTVLSVVLFLWLMKRSCHIWCAVLLNDNMDLHMSSLDTLLAEGPWCVFYATRCQVYWGLTQCGFLLVLSFYISHTHTHTHTHTQIHTHTKNSEKENTGTG